MKYLHQIKGRWAVRIVVRPDLQAEVGRKELRRWLGPSKRAAERKAPAIIAEFLSIIDAAEARMIARRPSLREIAKDHFKYEVLSNAKTSRMTRPRQATEDEAGHFQRIDDDYYEALGLAAENELHDDEAEALIGWAVDRAIASGRLGSSYNRAQLRTILAKVQQDVIARKQAKIKDRIEEYDPRFDGLGDNADEDAQNNYERNFKRRGGQPVSQLLMLFHKERKAGRGSLSVRTMKEQQVAVRMLEEVLGRDVAAVSVSKQDILRFKNVLMNAPTNYRQRFPGKTIEAAIELNKKRAEPYKTLDPSTINNKWLAHLSALFQWCEDNGHIPSNPVRGVRVSEGRGNSEPTRLPFSTEDLRRIFGTEMFDDPAAYGTQQWALLLALYTGARSSSELARINAEDVYQDQGIWLIYFAEASKNTRSKRVVPVHPKLIELGFLGFVDSVRKRDGGRIFNDWTPEDKINRWFLRTYKKQVGITDRRKVLHSFRHTLKTALARYGVNRDIMDLIIGHKDQSVGGIYIAEPGFTMLKSMRDELARVEFGINLPRSSGR